MSSIIYRWIQTQISYCGFQHVSSLQHGINHGHLEEGLIRIGGFIVPSLAAQLVDLGNSSDDARLDAALVDSTNDAEETFLSPVLVPRVDDEPVRNSIIDAPSDHLHSVSSAQFTCLVHVHSTGVVEEVLVDLEGDLHGTVSHDFLKDSLDVVLDTVGGLAVVLVLVVGAVGVARDALLLALGSGEEVRLAGVVVGLEGVVLAGREGVGLAARVRGEVAAGDNAVLDPVLPRGERIATVASESARFAAREKIVGGDGNLDLGIRCDADTVGNGLGGAERPARS
ncbi:hypothetical protein PENTCL1PPCAC_27605 [Pristionchus entomophagus]|uniref:Ribosomal protein n=1 Tax=Pristionchus entomophagus TaxID=358040 RepID=A0AAV5UFR9_9BILA|nr:hypothetical protein PENTCL1PPCAC_27605 [Pristionchus entomophagus]